jgi:hypothetical protein
MPAEPHSAMTTAVDAPVPSQTTQSHVSTKTAYHAAGGGGGFPVGTLRTVRGSQAGVFVGIGKSDYEALSHKCGVQVIPNKQ